MIVDARTLDDGIELMASVVIIGGGVAGITMALELEAKGIDAILLESGGRTPDDATRDLYRGESTALPRKWLSKAIRCGGAVTSISPAQAAPPPCAAGQIRPSSCSAA